MLPTMYMMRSYQNTVANMVNQLIQQGTSQANQDFRKIASDIIRQDNNLYTYLFEGIMTEGELAAANNQLNPNDVNQLAAMVDQHYHNFIPYVIFNTIMNRMNLDYHLRSQLENDARVYISRREEIARNLAFLQNQNNVATYNPTGYQAPNPGGYNPFGNQPVGQPYNAYAAASTNYYDKGNSNVPANNIMQQKGSTPQSNNSGHPGIFNCYRQSEENEVSHVMLDSIKVEEPSRPNNAPKQPAHPLGSLANLGNHSGEDISQLMGSEVHESICWFDNGHSLWDYREHRGWYEETAPKHLYPIDEEEIKWERDLGYIIRDNVKYYVFRFNPKQKLIPTIDRRYYRYILKLDEDFLPYFEAIRKEEEDILDYQDHLIPGMRPKDNVFSTYVPIRDELAEGKKFSKVVESLELSEEEIAEQTKRIEAEGDTVEHYMLVKDEVCTASPSHEVMVTDVLDKLRRNKPNAKLVKNAAFLSNDTFTRENRREWLQSIKKCTNLDDFVEYIYNKAIHQEEYVLANRLCRLIDYEYAKVLVKLGITNIVVTDVLDCHLEVFEHYIKPRGLVNEYEKLIQDMLKYFYHDEGKQLFEPEEDGDNTLTCLYKKNVVYYVKRLLGELHLSRNDINNDTGWMILDKKVKQELHSILFHAFVNRFKGNGENGADIYVITEDGALIEAMTPDPLNLSDIYIRIRSF